jgi:uncharacterized protein YggE
MLTLFQRTVIVVLAFGFLVVALVVAAKAPVAQATTFAPALSLPVNAVIPAGVVTTGDATVKAKPDGAIVTVGTIVQGATADEAQTQLSGRIANILDRAKVLAIPDADTKTVGYRIDPQYAYEPGKAPRLTGFQASQQITLTLHSPDAVGKALDTLVQGDGATTVTVAFALLDAKAAQASAREQAIQDARAKAQAMATTAGVQLGKVISVNDIGLTPTIDGSIKSTYTALAIPAPAAVSQLPSGELQVVVRVQVQWELAP